jgi:hypothetical protein
MGDDMTLYVLEHTHALSEFCVQLDEVVDRYCAEPKENWPEMCVAMGHLVTRGRALRDVKMRRHTDFESDGWLQEKVGSMWSCMQSLSITVGDTIAELNKATDITHSIDRETQQLIKHDVEFIKATADRIFNQIATTGAIEEQDDDDNALADDATT